MKKLLATILAFSCAFGAWAEAVSHFSGTDFSTYPVGAFSTETDDSGVAETDQRYWFTGSKEDIDGDVVNVSSNEETGVTVNYLEFESSITNPVYRTVRNSFGAKAPDATTGENANQGFLAKKIGNGLFIDTEVQFTPYLVNENHPSPTTLTDKDKIIVWVKETESDLDGDHNTTNLIVTAGYIEAGGIATPKEYVIDYDADLLCKGKHRLTIKAFEDISAHPQLTIAGFVVYIDEQEVSYSGNQTAFSIDVSLDTTPGNYYTNEKKSLFPSLMGNTSGGTLGGDEISAVGFAGMGQVGEVWFDDYSTAYPAFASDDINFTIKVGNGVTSYRYNGETYTETRKFAVKPGTASIEVTDVMYDTANGWKAKAGTWFAGETIVMNAGTANGDSGTFSFENGSQFTITGFKANFFVGDVEYETFLGNISENGGALNAAITSGNELKMMSDVDVLEVITIGVGKSLILDLNGHTIMSRGNYEATIQNIGTLTINDSKGGGKVLGVINGTEYVNISIINGGTLTINGGSYEGVVPEIVDDEQAGTTVGNATINGGKFALSTVLDDNGEERKPTKSDFHLATHLGDPNNKEVTISQDKEFIATGDAFNGIAVPHVYYATVTAPEVTYTITYVSDKATVPDAVNVKVASGNSYALTEGNLPTLEAAGFTFGGWSLTEGGAAVEAGYEINSSIMLYALWTEAVDPWKPAEETDVSATNKVAEIFGKDSPAATNITTYVDYTNLVEYIKTVKKSNPGSTPDSLTTDEKTYIIESLKLGAETLFTAEPKIELTEAMPSTKDNAEAGDWEFTVKVTQKVAQGDVATALKVAKEKVKALVKIRSDLKNGTWDAPQAANIEANYVPDGNEISIKIKFGDAKSGFMMIAE